jgi:hypothetical protein
MNIPQQAPGAGQAPVWAALQAVSACLAQSQDTRSHLPGQTGSLQRLYEIWLKRDEWRVYQEALPLLFGIPPEHWNAWAAQPGADNAVAALWREIQAAVEHGRGPPVVNPRSAATDWMVRPQDLHTWAHNGGFELPEPFDTLMSFIAKVLSTPAAVSLSPVADKDSSSDREAVLGAALAVVASFPEQCRGDAGWIEAEAVVDAILAKSAIWFERGPPMPRPAMVELIDKWFGTL